MRETYLPKVTGVEVLDASRYLLWLTFDDGTQGDLDMSHLRQRGGVFEALHDPEAFTQVAVVGSTIGWPGDIDLDPENLYERVLERLTGRAQTA